MHKIIYAGDSWAAKAWTEQNWQLGPHLTASDTRMADFWELEYTGVYAGGWGNLEILEKLKGIDGSTPVIWIYTEPGRDYGRITGKDEFDWIRSEDIMLIRQQLDEAILVKIRATLPNPLALVGGLSDVNVELAENLGFTVLHPSWQKFMAEQIQSTAFRFGWGATDIGWRLHQNNIIPSKRALFESESLVREWWNLEQQGYMCHDHPSVKSNQQFAQYLKPAVQAWVSHI